ncbi:MAG: hypothetical protein KF693_02130 [Nitrospira sp.]|nr:hypothetical protein [Nitrospira sp.]
MRMRGACLGVVVSASVFLTACSSIGPATLPRDRFDYSSAIAESWKHQALLNIVKLRYMDPPIFVDVANIVSGYQLQTTLQAGGTVSADPSSLPTMGSFFNAGAQATYIDRPTITYTPLTGDQYIRGIMTPIRPEQIFSSILAGWPADVILFSSVDSLNGLTNQSFGRVVYRAADPKFIRILEILRKLQLSGALGFRIKENKEKQMTNVVFFRQHGLSEEDAELAREARELLNLDPAEHDFHLVFGPTASSRREIAVQTRSLIQIMSEVGGQADIPELHITEGRATPGLAQYTGEKKTIRFFGIHSSTDKAKDAYLTVRYRDHWFWIDDRDLKSKQAFAFLLLIFALADTGEKRALPLITIPAQ